MGKLVQEIHKRLRAQGGRMTTQRRLILETLETLANHPTAEELFALARQQDSSLNLSTVYRTLRLLEEEDLVSGRIFNEERRQERFDPAYPSEHHHFMCTACKSVIEFETDLIARIKMQFEHKFDARVESGSIVFYGLCSQCRLERDPAKPGSGAR